MSNFMFKPIITRSKKLLLRSSCFLAVMITLSPLSWAAVGCTLNDPDRDVLRLFPASSGYKTEFITIEEWGGEAFFKKLKTLLGGEMDPVYETIDVPYAFYDILKGKEVIGRIHGVNQKGTYGGMQLILATDLNGKIISFYYQKMSSPEAGKFMDKKFTKKFEGLKLSDFTGKMPAIEDPSKSSKDDFILTLRGLKKNLILLDAFKLSKEKKNEK